MTLLPTFPPNTKILVIGGGGFLGKSICQLLLDNEEEAGSSNVQVSVFDLRLPADLDRERLSAVIQGDITSIDSLLEAFQGQDIVIHTASPIHGLPASVYHKVNVQGTLNVIEACIKAKVKKLIYTSSAGVVYNGNDLHYVDEATTGYCEVHMDAYNETKAMAEGAVLKANGMGGGSLLTCAIRPSAIFGPRDAQGSLAIVESAKKGQWKVMIGDNQNLFDMTFVDNASHAHILAASKMEKGSGIEGQAFFITNDQPIFFWDYPKLLFHYLGYRGTHSVRLPEWFAYGLGDVMDFFTWALSPFKTLHPTLTRFRVKIITGNRYYNISKAKDLLGYKPIVPLIDGFKKTADYWKSQGYGVAA